MFPGKARVLCAPILALAFATAALQQAEPQAAAPTGAAAVATLALTDAQKQQLIAFMQSQDYVAAEKLLLAEIDKNPHSAQAAKLLAFAGSVYFLKHDFLNAAIAWKHSEAIEPLDSPLRFSQAMAYIKIGREAWARDVLRSLASTDPKNALYPYWLGRLDYDAHEYNNAIRSFQRAIELDPNMARAYDNLGLCLYYQNDNPKAIENFRKAIELERGSTHPSPWPYLNLAVAQQFLNEQRDAEANLRTALRLDPEFAQAHFQLATVLEDEGRLEDAVKELKEAVRANPSYPEPHMALARLLHRLGRDDEARRQVQVYRQLHPPSTPDKAPDPHTPED